MDKKYMIAPGKSISTRVGIVSEYQEITAKKIGSQTIFEKLIEAGAIVPAAPVPEQTATFDLRRSPAKPVLPHSVLPSPAVARPVSVEVIEPEAAEEVADPPKVGRPRKKNLFADEAEIVESAEDSE